MTASGLEVRPPLVLTMGDPAGIGIEIALMAWARRVEAKMPAFAFFADPEVVAARARLLRLDAEIEIIDALGNAASVFQRRLPILPVRVACPVEAGKPDARNASAIIGAIEEATAVVVRGEACALVTNPIAKSVLYDAGFTHAGHTEFLASLAAPRGVPPPRPLMMLAADELKVVPLTVHIPLADVPRSVTREAILASARILHDALRRDFGIDRPRISVAGLNPHAGEDGAIGREEEEIIAPAVAVLQGEGLVITGPHSADTLFHEHARSRYDAVLAMYHDQALIPLKTLAFDRGVNVTLGLPFVRTSPDHGTAFDIAGSGRARAESLIASLRLADAIAVRRAKSRARDGR